MIYTINSRLGMTGTVTQQPTYLQWDITSPIVVSFSYGAPQMIPLVGDWNGDGIEGIGAYDPTNTLFHLKDFVGTGSADYMIPYGAIGDIPISWYDSGNNRDRMGVIRSLCAYLRKTLSSGVGELGVKISDLVCSSSSIVRQCTIPTGVNIGLLAVRSTPAGAEIFIDSVDTGYKTPYSVCGLSGGTHYYKLTLSGYSDATGSIYVTLGQETVIDVPFTPCAQPGCGFSISI